MISLSEYTSNLPSRVSLSEHQRKWRKTSGSDAEYFTSNTLNLKVFLRYNNYNTLYIGGKYMSRATTKEELIKAADEQFKKMWGLIDAMPDDEQTALFNFGADAGKEAHWGRDKNLRDVLIHLFEWHQLLITWINSNLNGEVKSFLPEPYNWKTYGQMNVEFWEKHQSTPYNTVRKMLLDSHEEVIRIINKFSNDELFEKKHFSWTGTSSLGSYCVSATSSHYDWAIKKIKMHHKTYQNHTSKI